MKTHLARKLSRRLNYHRHRAVEYGVEDTITADQLLAIFQNAKGKCHYCHDPVGTERLVIDHRIPMRRGGGNTMDNVVAACRWCNDSKGLKTEQEYRVYMAQKREQPDDHTLIRIICEKLGIDPDVYGSRTRAVRFALNFTARKLREPCDQ